LVSPPLAFARGAPAARAIRRHTMQRRTCSSKLFASRLMRKQIQKYALRFFKYENRLAIGEVVNGNYAMA
jgi:hypothetical protein